MKLKQITFRRALVILSEGGKIYLCPDYEGNQEPIYLDESDHIHNVGYMELVDFPHMIWHEEVKETERGAE